MKVSKPAYERFMASCMQPVPAAELADFNYNRMMRKAREDAWKAALYRYQGDKWLVSGAGYIVLSMMRRRATPDLLADLKEWRECEAKNRQDLYWSAENLIRTPASDLAGLAFKKDVAKKRAFIKGLTGDEISAFIAADEEFLAAHPVNSRRVGRRKELSNN